MNAADHDRGRADDLRPPDLVRRGPVEAPGSLREAAAHADLQFGAAVAVEPLADAAYRAAIATHYTMIEAENAMKWAALRPSREAFDFSGGDAIVRAAAAHGQRVRGHVLAWHAYNPAWLVRGRFEPETLGRLLRTHVETVVDHFAGDLFAWDVVNEAVADQDRLVMRPSIWHDRPGIGHAGQGSRYVEEIFRWARGVAPGTLLFYNDDPAASPLRGTAMRALLRELLDRDVPIDGVGVQLHLDLGTDPSRLEDELGMLAELGLAIHVTELDVAMPIDPVRRLADPGDLERQADLYGRVVAFCIDLPGCTALQTWGVDDGHSWIPTFSRGAAGAALLLDESYRPKPAYHAVTTALARRGRALACTRQGAP